MGDACFASPASPTNAMDVVLESERESVVDDIFYIRNVESSGCHVSSDQKSHCS